MTNTCRSQPQTLGPGESPCPGLLDPSGPGGNQIRKKDSVGVRKAHSARGWWAAGIRLRSTGQWLQIHEEENGTRRAAGSRSKIPKSGRRDHPLFPP